MHLSSQWKRWSKLICLFASFFFLCPVVEASGDQPEQKLYPLAVKIVFCEARTRDLTVPILCYREARDESL